MQDFFCIVQYSKDFFPFFSMYYVCFFMFYVSACSLLAFFFILLSNFGLCFDWANNDARGNICGYQWMSLTHSLTLSLTRFTFNWIVFCSSFFLLCKNHIIKNIEPYICYYIPIELTLLFIRNFIQFRNSIFCFIQFFYFEEHWNVLWIFRYPFEPNIFHVCVCWCVYPMQNSIKHK